MPETSLVFFGIDKKWKGTYKNERKLYVREIRF